MVARRAEQASQRGEQVEQVFRDLGYESTPTVSSLLASYISLPRQTMTPLHQLHYLGAETLLKGALFGYSNALDVAAHNEWTSQYRLDEIQADFTRTVEASKSLGLAFPTDVLTTLSFKFLDFSLDNATVFDKKIIDASKEMGIAVGGDAILVEKATYITETYLDAAKSIRDAGRKVNVAQSAQIRSDVAEQMLLDLGATLRQEQIPPLIDSIQARTGVAAVASTLIFGSLLGNSVAANAAEVQPPVAPVVGVVSAQNVQTVENVQPAETVVPAQTATSAESGMAVNAALPSITDNSGADISPLIANDAAPASKDSASNKLINVGATVPNTNAAKEPTVSPVSPVIASTTPAPVAEKAVAVAPVVPKNADKAPDVSPVASGVDTQKSSQDVSSTAPVESAPVLPVVLTDKAGSSSPDTSPDISAVSPEIAPAPVASPDQAPLTQNQLRAQRIVTDINNGVDFATTSARLRIYFHDKNEVATSFSNGQPVFATTNPDLVKNLADLENKFSDIEVSKGHSDVNYINTALITLAVLDAAANDKSVLASQDVQDMIKGAVRPTDTYAGRLFDQYLATAKTTLETKIALNADGSPRTDGATMLTGLEQYKDQIENLYAYSLMANSSDADQSAAKQKMIDEEKAAAIAAAAANNTSNQTPEAEAIDTLVRQETDKVKKTEYVVMQFFMNKGLKDYQAAAIAGNFYIETGRTMDPLQDQKGGGPGKYFAQLEAGRRAAYEAAAAAAGKDPGDIPFQLEYYWDELHTTRKWALPTLLAATDVHQAARAFEEDFETPWVSFKGTTAQKDAQAKLRGDNSKAILDAYTAELTTVNNARAAAAAALAKAAADQANMTKLIDTALSKISDSRMMYTGPRDKNGADFGQCTYGAWELEKAMGIVLPTDLGDGKDWNSSLVRHGYTAQSVPHVGDVWNTTTYTSKKNKHGHVAVVYKVYANGSIDIAEMNHTHNNGYDIRNIPASVVQNQSSFTKVGSNY